MCKVGRRGKAVRKAQFVLIHKTLPDRRLNPKRGGRQWAGVLLAIESPNFQKKYFLASFTQKQSNSVDHKAGRTSSGSFTKLGAVQSVSDTSGDGSSVIKVTSQRI